MPLSTRRTVVLVHQTQFEIASQWSQEQTFSSRCYRDKSCLEEMWVCDCVCLLFSCFFLCFLCSRVKLCFSLLLVNVVSWLSCECARRNDYEFYFLSVFHQLYAMFICFVFLLLPSNNNNKEFYIWKSQSLTKTTHVDSTTHNNGHLYMRYTHANKQRYEIGRSAQKEEVKMCGYFISMQCRKNQ